MSGVRTKRDWEGLQRPQEYGPPPPIFNPAAEAPLNTYVQVQVKDSAGPYVLPFKCRLTQDGWVNQHGSKLAVTVTGWRHGGWTTKRRARG